MPGLATAAVRGCRWGDGLMMRALTLPVWLLLLLAALPTALAARAACSAGDVGQLVAELERNACTHATVRPSLALTSAAEAQLVANALRSSSALTSVVFSGGKVSDEHLAILAGALAAPTSKIASLVFWDNGFGSTGLQALLDALASSPAIATLHISDNRLGDAGAAVLAALLPKTRITALVLTDTGFGPVGAKAIAGALAKNRLLSRLVISGSCMLCVCV